MKLCPYLKDPVVARDFNELKEATSEAAAYHIWSLNNGNAIDKAPNGAESKLFQDLLKYYNGDRTKAIQAKAKTYGNSFLKWFGDWINDPQNASKVVDENGEPLVVYHGNKYATPITRFQEGYKNTWNTTRKGFFFTDNLEDAQYFADTTNIPEQLSSLKEYLDKVISNYTILNKSSEFTPPIKKGKILVEFYDTDGGPLYVYADSNSKEAIVKAITNSDAYKDNLHEYSRLKQFENSPGQIVKVFLNIKDTSKIEPYLNGRQFIVDDSNQIKFVDDNVVDESQDVTKTEQESSESSDERAQSSENDVYYNILRVDHTRAVKSLLLKLGAIVKARPSGYYMVNEGWATLKIKELCDANGLVPNLYKLQSGRIKISFSTHESVLAPTAQDKISKEKLIDPSTLTVEEMNKEGAVVDSVVEFLQETFPQLNVVYITSRQLSEPRFEGIDKFTNSFVKGDTVYLIKGRITSEIVIEELLHPLVYTVARQNYNLFTQFVKEAKKDFPKLYAQIQDRYTDSRGFNEDNRQLELVTQVLARYVNKKYKSGEKKSKLSELINKFFNYIGVIMNNFIGKFTGKDHDFDDIKKMSLSELADIVLAEDSKFLVYTTSEVQHNIQSNQQKAQKVSEDITKRFYTLYRAYEKLPNKSLKRLRLQNLIFETFNKLKLTQDYYAVTIALDFALENLGAWNYDTNQPMKEDSISGYLWKQMNKQDPWSGVTPDILVDMYTNSIGFYADLLSNYIPNSLDNMMTSDDRKKADQLDTLIKRVIKPMWLQAMAAVGDRIVDETVDQEVDASDEDKENMKIVAKDWLHKNIMYGDIHAIASYIYNNAYSSNPIIKQAFNFILYAETKTLEEIQPIARRITKAYRAADKGFKSFGPNWQTLLMEFDIDGIPTGNFIRPVNYGQYEKDLTEFVKQLNEKFKNTYGWSYIDDGTGMIINSLTGELADNEEWGPNGEQPVYIKYLMEIERFKCERSNRRYTFAYYAERMSLPYRGSLDPYDTNTNRFGHGLSPKTLARYNYILSNINYYLDLCTDLNTGFSYPERLSMEDKKKLDDWYYELEKLSNPYDEKGIPKTDDERQMALEIRAWQKWLGDQLKTTIDLDKFTEEYQRVIDEANRTNNPNLVNDFFKYNTQLGINPDFIEQTLGQFPKLESGDLAVIHAKLLKKSLQNLIKTQTGYTKGLSKVEDSPSFWLDCKHTDLIIENGRIKQSKDFAKMMEDNFKFLEVLYRDANGFAIDSNGNQVQPLDEKLHNDLLTYREHMIIKYTNLAMDSASRTIPGLNDENGNPIVFNGTAQDVRKVMTKLFSYQKELTDEEGNVELVWVPLSIFTMMLPKNDKFFNITTGRHEDTMLYVPKGRFAEKSDRHGKYINNQYDHSDLNAEQPKIDYVDQDGNRRYDNSEAYSEMEKDKAVKDLYDLLIEEMKNAQQNYQTTNRRFNYRLPQINANTMQIWSRILKRGVGNTLEALYESATTVEENDESMRTSEDYLTNPDGTVATDVPLKFIRRLKHPENITTDIAGSVILFANMAINYKNKVEIDAKIKALRYNLDYQNRQELYTITSKKDPNELPPSDNEKSITMFDSMTNKHLYGNQWSNDPNLTLSMSDNTPKNGWLNIAKSTSIGGAIGAVGGGAVGALLGSPAAGAIIGGAAGAGIGLLNGAIQNGLLEGIAFFKTMKNIQRLETTQTLALNIFSMLVGFGDSNSRIIKESLMGKYMTIRDIITSFAHCIWYTLPCLVNIGNPLANNKLTRAMLLNGVSKGIHLTYEHLNYGRTRKVASNLLMGGFSLLDWMANALLLRAFYNNVRFYDGNKVKKGFYTLYELELAFLNAGYSKNQARLSHMMCFQTLWGAYDSNMEVKPKWKQYVTPKIKKRIRSKTLNRGALYNGMNPDNDIPRWKQDVVGSIVGALRAWLAQATQHLIAGGTDNIVREIKKELVEETHGTRTKPKTKYKYVPLTDELRSKAMSWNYETGVPQDLIWVGIFRSFKTLGKKILRLILLDYAGSKLAKFSEVEKYAWKDALIYLGVLGAMMYGWTFVHDWATDVPKPKDRYHAAPEGLSPAQIYDYMANVYIPNEYWKLQIDNIAFRTIESQITSIDPSTMSDVVNSFTALKNGLGEHLGIVKPLADISGISGHSLDEINKQGGYKFYTRGDRTLYKFIGPLDNLHTAFTYYGITENMKFYTNTYGGIYRAFGYDFKKNLPKKSKDQSNDTGFGGDSGFGGTGFGGGTGF